LAKVRSTPILFFVNWTRRWLQRHRHPGSRVLHAIGIPLTLAAVALALLQLHHGRWDLWWRPIALLLAGYALQWIGHRLEGNDMGEYILLKRLLGKPYVAVSPRYQAQPMNTNPAEQRPAAP